MIVVCVRLIIYYHVDVRPYSPTPLIRTFIIHFLLSGYFTYPDIALLSQDIWITEIVLYI